MRGKYGSGICIECNIGNVYFYEPDLNKLVDDVGEKCIVLAHKVAGRSSRCISVVLHAASSLSTAQKYCSAPGHLYYPPIRYRLRLLQPLPKPESF